MSLNEINHLITIKSFSIHIFIYIWKYQIVGEFGLFIDLSLQPCLLVCTLYVVVLNRICCPFIKTIKTQLNVKDLFKTIQQIRVVRVWTCQYKYNIFKLLNDNK